MESLSVQLIPVFDWLLRTTLQAALLFCLIMLRRVTWKCRVKADAPICPKNRSTLPLNTCCRKPSQNYPGTS